jgi:hypothetical protein
MTSNIGNDANQPVVRDETTGGRAITPPPPVSILSGTYLSDSE